MYRRLRDLLTPEVPFKWKSPGGTEHRKADLFPWWGCSNRTRGAWPQPTFGYHCRTRSRFQVNGTHVCKENTIAKREVRTWEFCLPFVKSWTDRVTNLGSLENTSGSLLTSKATPQAAGNINNHRVWSKQSYILIAIQNLDMHTANIFIPFILIV